MALSIPIAITASLLMLLANVHGKSVNFIGKRKGEIDGEDIQIHKQRTAAKGLDLEHPFEPERAALPLPPLPPSAPPLSHPAAGEFTFSMMIQPSPNKKIENLEAEETDEALLLPPGPSSATPRSPPPAITGTKNIGLVDEYTDDPFEFSRNGQPRSNSTRPT